MKRIDDSLGLKIFSLEETLNCNLLTLPASHLVPSNASVGSTSSPTYVFPDLEMAEGLKT